MHPGHPSRHVNPPERFAPKSCGVVLIPLGTRHSPSVKLHRERCTSQVTTAASLWPPCFNPPYLCASNPASTPKSTGQTLALICRVAWILGTLLNFSALFQTSSCQRHAVTSQRRYHVAFLVKNGGLPHTRCCKTIPGFKEGQTLICTLLQATINSCEGDIPLRV